MEFAPRLYLSRVQRQNDDHNNRGDNQDDRALPGGPSGVVVYTGIRSMTNSRLPPEHAIASCYLYTQPGQRTMRHRHSVTNIHDALTLFVRIPLFIRMNYAVSRFK